MEIKQVFHPFNIWEDWKEGMYKATCFMDDTQMVHDCYLLLSCPEYFHECASFIIHNWPKSTEHNLTNRARNRQAWLGQASCCFAHGAPEYLTKQAWGLLTEKQQKIANAVADDWIAHFEKRYLEKSLLWQK